MEFSARLQVVKLTFQMDMRKPPYTNRICELPTDLISHGHHGLFSSHSYIKSQNEQQTQETTSGSAAGLFGSRNVTNEESPVIGSGQGLFGSHHEAAQENPIVAPAQRVEEYHGEETVPLEKVATSDSDDSSYTGVGEASPKKLSGSSASGSPDDFGGRQLERRVTRSEIDDQGRRELQRILTSASQKMTRQISIAQPGDPSIDPSSDSFDLTKFLRTFRHNLESEGMEMKQLSVVYKGLNVFGSGKAIQLQKTVTDLVMAPLRFREYFGKSDRKQILHSFDGIIRAGELCVVLGRPGSGCSTLLKALTGELHGLETDESVIHYNGITQKKMIKEFKGETVYNQEVDKHFPHLTVGQTLEFAAAVRTPSNRPGGMSRKEFAQFLAQVVMAVLGLSHTYNTKVGNDFVRGGKNGKDVLDSDRKY